MTLKHLDFQSLSPILEVFPQGLIAIDLETTGLSPLIDRIIEFAAVRITPGGVETLESLINPNISIPKETIQFHGINDVDVKDSPSLLEFMPKILSFIGDLPIVAHNAKFDLGFLVFALHNFNLPYPSSDIYCSVKMSRQSFKEIENYKLSTISKYFDIPLENHHRAMDDTIACLLIFKKALERLSGKELKNALKESLLFNSSDFKRNKHIDLEGHLIDLRKRVRKQQMIFIKYNGGSYKNRLRPIRPVSLLPMPQGNVLYAHCLLTDMYKSFALSKIKEIKEMKASDISESLAGLEKKQKKGIV
jgi:DNA polymerase III epsilon subunit family exonuclease